MDTLLIGGWDNLQSDHYSINTIGYQHSYNQKLLDKGRRQVQPDQRLIGAG